MLAKNKCVKWIVLIIVILLIPVGILFSSAMLWNLTFFLNWYELDSFTEEHYGLIIEAFDLPTEIEAELIRLTVEDGFRENSEILVFFVKNEEAMQEYISQNFGHSLQDPNESSSYYKIQINGKEFYATEIYDHKKMSYTDIIQYVSDAGGKVYRYMRTPLDNDLREMMRKEGKDITKDIIKKSS